MTDHSDRVRRLAKVLQEHECWDSDKWRQPKELRDDEWRLSWIAYAVDYPHVAKQDNGLGALGRAVVEVESSAVMGAPDRCAVCGVKAATLDEWPQTQTWLCGHHSADYHPCCAALRSARSNVRRSNGESLQDWTIRIVLRARRLYREGKAKAAPQKPTPEPYLTTCGLCFGAATPECAAWPFVVDQRRTTVCRVCGATAVYSWTSQSEWACWKSWTAKPAPHVHTWALVERGITSDRWGCTGCDSFQMRTAASNPVREWGMEYPRWMSNNEQPSTLKAWRDRLRAGKIRAEVPEKHARRCELCGGPVVETQIPGMYLCVNRCLTNPEKAPRIRFNPLNPQHHAQAVFRDTCAKSDCAWRHGNGIACAVCSGWRQAESWFSTPAGSDYFRRAFSACRLGMAEARRSDLEMLASLYGVPVSGNPRGDGFLRDLWRKEEAETERGRNADAGSLADEWLVEKVMRAIRLRTKRENRPSGKFVEMAARIALAVVRSEEKKGEAEKDLRERVAEAIYETHLRRAGLPWSCASSPARENARLEADAAIREVRQ